MTKEFDEVMTSFDGLDLREKAFDLDAEGAQGYFDFIDDDEDNSDEFIDVVDTDAKSEEEVKDSYLGDIVLQCAVCHTALFKNKEEITIEDGEDEEKIADIGEECPVCGGEGNFKVVGVVTPYVEVDVEVDDEESAEDESAEDEDEKEDVNEGLEDESSAAAQVAKDACKDKECKENNSIDTEKQEVEEALQKAVNKFARNKGLKEGADISIEGDDINVETDKVSVDVSSKESDDYEGISEIEDEDEFFADEEEIEDEGEIEDEEGMTEIDVDEVSEDEVEEALIRAKPHLRSFRMTEARGYRSKIVIEGIGTTFSRGHTREKIVLSPRKTRNGKVSFMVEGISGCRIATGRVKNRKLVVESFIRNKRGANRR